MKKKKLSISDVARAMGVSVTTVSFVLNDKGVGRISPGVIRKIKDYAKKVGYQPNPLVRNRRGNKSKTFGVLVEHIASPSQGELAYQLEKIFRQSGHHTLVMSMNGDSGSGEELLHVLKEKEVNGYVLMGFENMERSVKKLVEGSIPVVLYNCQVLEAKAPSVYTDYGTAIIDAVNKHFKANTQSRLGLVACASNPYSMRAFLEGYMEVMDLHARDVLIKKVQSALQDVEIEEQIRDFIHDNRLDAVLFSSERCVRIGRRVASSVDNAITYIDIAQDITVSAENIVATLLSQYDGKKLL